MSAARKIVVTGATGKQGGALISALVAAPASPPFEIYAVTRNASSSGAKALASKPHVHVIQGDFNDPAAIFAQVPQPWGLFSVTMPMNAKVEEQQGKAMTAAALAAGTRHIVFTSVQRGVNSDTDPTPVPHFASKFNIEQDIIAKTKADPGVTYTFLRPVAFYENFTADFMGKGFSSMWRGIGKERPLQLVSTSDIGKVAAEAFTRAADPAFRNTSIPLAGDEISYVEAAKVFQQTVGQPMPTTFDFVGSTIKLLLHEQLGIMFKWFSTTGFGADVKANKAQFPYMQDFATWLTKESQWKKV